MPAVDILPAMTNHSHQLVVQEPPQNCLIWKLLPAHSILNWKSIDMYDKYLAFWRYFSDIFALTLLLTFFACIILQLFLLSFKLEQFSVWNCVDVSILNICGLFLAVHAFCCVLRVNLEDWVESFEHTGNSLTLLLNHFEQLDQVLHWVLMVLAFPKFLRSTFLQVRNCDVFYISFAWKFRQ